ncbi:uncharacterized protein LOC123219552 [Mangifera indica]|uniref:uncharacterized protein LOC123219552 n=1 Tax=Mangifera indica TaxID=29780 RepID=UPI001CFBFD76|nr:uncharacterized protein LOC123219552 [Mangifera indica]
MAICGNVEGAQTESSTTEEKTLSTQNSTSSLKSEDQIELRNRHFKLYLDAVDGDWNSAEKIFEEDKIDITAILSKKGDTALHIAAACGRTGFVKKLLEQMNKEDLAIENNAGNTAFFLAAASGKVEIAEAMMEKNEDVVKIRGFNDMLPLHKAAMAGDKEMVEYLYEATGDELLDDNDRFDLLVNLLHLGLYDIALDLAERHPQVALARDKNEETALHHLARITALRRRIDSSLIRFCKRTAFFLYNEVKRNVIKTCHSVLGKQRVKKKEEQKGNELGLRDRIKQREQRMKQQRRDELSFFVGASNRGRIKQKVRNWIAGAIRQVMYADQQIPDSAFEIVRCLWKQVMLLDESQILEIVRKPHSLVLEAAKQGNPRFLMIIILSYPDLVYEVDENNHTIFHFAAMYRRFFILKQIYRVGLLKDFVVQNIDKDGNNILHLAAKLPPADRPDNESAALHYQMAREMSFFWRVEDILHPVDAEAKNKEGKTPRALFTEEHRELRQKAERWVKDIANGCIMGATLIATVVFAAAFTVPGGINDSGTPNLVRRVSFIIFAISDAIALLFSIFSVLMFLTVISSRYEEADFGRLMYDLGGGLNLLILAVQAVMVMFCATMFLLFNDGLLWVPILVTTMAVLTSFRSLEKYFAHNGEVAHLTGSL